MIESQHMNIGIFDAWIQEAEEAARLAQDIEFRMKEKDSVAAGGDPSLILFNARRKFMLLGTKLDQLESLLYNPPAKPILSESELQSRRDMIIDMRQRTRQLGNYLCTSQSSRNQDAEATNQCLTSEQAAKSHSSSSENSPNKITKSMKPQNTSYSDEKQTVMMEETRLEIPLLDDVKKDALSNDSKQLMVQNHSAVIGNWLDRWFESCRPTFSVLLIIIAILLLVFIIVAIIKFD